MSSYLAATVSIVNRYSRMCFQSEGHNINCLLLLKHLIMEHKSPVKASCVYHFSFDFPVSSQQVLSAEEFDSFSFSYKQIFSLFKLCSEHHATNYIQSMTPSQSLMTLPVENKHMHISTKNFKFMQLKKHQSNQKYVYVDITLIL